MADTQITGGEIKFKCPFKKCILIDLNRSVKTLEGAFNKKEAIFRRLL